ncbi:MAG: DinB family protein [Anaerolineae bacterium]|nr:DinB family protein [Anaerolineae bacterium]
MTIAFFRMLLAHDDWANRKLWDGIHQLTDEQFERELNYSHGALRNQVLHLISIAFVWPTRLWHGTDAVRAMLPDWLGRDLPDRAALKTLWDEVSANLRAYLDTLSDADLTQTFAYDRGDGAKFVHRLDQLLTQVCLHSFDHRVQIMAVLHEMGVETFNQDLIGYLWSTAPGQDTGNPGAAYFRELFDYNAWATRKLWGLLNRVSDAQFMQEMDYSRGRLSTQVRHAMEAEEFFVGLVAGRSAEELEATSLGRDLTDESPRALMRERWAAVQDAAQATLADLTDADLTRTFTLPFGPEGRPHSGSELLMQALSHSLDHRAQIMAMLHRMAVSGFSQDYILYLWERDAK